MASTEVMALAAALGVTMFVLGTFILFFLQKRRQWKLDQKEGHRRHARIFSSESVWPLMRSDSSICYTDDYSLPSIPPTPGSSTYLLRTDGSYYIAPVTPRTGETNNSHASTLATKRHGLLFTLDNRAASKTPPGHPTNAEYYDALTKTKTNAANSTQAQDKEPEPEQAPVPSPCVSIEPAPRDLSARRGSNASTITNLSDCSCVSDCSAASECSAITAIPPAHSRTPSSVTAWSIAATAVPPTHSRSPSAVTIQSTAAIPSPTPNPTSAPLPTRKPKPAPLALKPRAAVLPTINFPDTPPRTGKPQQQQQQQFTRSPPVSGKSAQSFGSASTSTAAGPHYLRPPTSAASAASAPTVYRYGLLPTPPPASHSPGVRSNYTTAAAAGSIRSFALGSFASASMVSLRSRSRSRSRSLRDADTNGGGSRHRPIARSRSSRGLLRSGSLGRRSDTPGTGRARANTTPAPRGADISGPLVVHDGRFRDDLVGGRSTSRAGFADGDVVEQVVHVEEAGRGSGSGSGGGKSGRGRGRGVLAYEEVPIKSGKSLLWG